MFNEYSGRKRTGRWTLKKMKGNLSGLTGTLVTASGKKYTVKLYTVPYDNERQWEWAI